MRKILRFLKEYQSKHFDLGLYLLIALFLAVCFVFNYSLDFEDQYIDPPRNTFLHWLKMFFWMAFPFVSVCLILVAKKVVHWEVLNRSFWIRISIGFAILAMDRSFALAPLFVNLFSRVDYFFFSRCVFWSTSLLVNVIPLMLVYLAIEKERPRTFYGLAIHRFDARPYLFLLGIAIIFIGIGSFFSDIQEYYPRFNKSGGDLFAKKHHLPSWASLVIYELAYGSDFIAVEVFFRGFLIHAFARSLGGYAVLAMVSSYAFLHFGKPLTEAISSIFGGYILGIISYNNKNVWGGIIIHIGVAWSMEFFGYLQSLV